MATEVYDFDTIHDRKNTQAYKWTWFPDTIPLSVAEMEFPVAPEVLDALHQRVEHGFFGYTGPADELREVIVQKMKDLHSWDVNPDHILFNPGMVLMLNVIAQCVGKAGDGILMTMPAYGPFLRVPENRGRFPQMVAMTRVDDDASTFHYEMDFDAFEAAIIPQTSLYFLCNPHNPVGLAFKQAELERIAEICLKHDIVIASDDIHCEIQLGDSQHIPIASLSSEIADKTITMISHTKPYNMAGLACSAAIVSNDDLRERIQAKSRASGYHSDTLAFTAMLAAYRDSGAWLHAASRYITANRDYYVQFVRDNLPLLKTTIPDGTYMAWIDCSALNLSDEYDNASDFFFKEANVGLNPGTFFGDKFGDYVRLNFACPRAMLEEALHNMQAALEKLG
ncbi:MAG: PatB family C-S lyase [Anaerolineae bacterium]|nr:PatB family C-S lyase [Anaerolineae bacterium]